MATKEHRRFARGLIEELESRIHAGPPIQATEVASASEFLRQCSFSPASGYYQRLTEIQQRLAARVQQPPAPSVKRNYGGKAAGRWLQIQSVHDHVILSTCYEGQFNLKHGRVKISHRFNREGRIDFVELKFLRSLMPCLTGEIRKLVLVKDYQVIHKDWHEAEAFALQVLPQELLFLFADIFRCAKSDRLAWLINIGHRMAGDVCVELNGAMQSHPAPSPAGPQNQLCLAEVRTDGVARPILEKAAALEAVVELNDDKHLVVRYHGI